jgi:alkanesulfonate monooxygenase SsuD/methylene tetrahydromethanopterin reductase-like flavin-dependent oxidoreductase (luciferase family)
LGAIDRLSDGRLIAGVGPGSSSADYTAVGLHFSERWQRFDEAISALRALWRPDGTPFVGRFYSTAGLSLEPRPAQPYGPPIWVGSWGSDAGLRRVARLADGWLASAYNTTPELFGEAWQALRVSRSR